MRSPMKTILLERAVLLNTQNVAEAEPCRRTPALTQKYHSFCIFAERFATIDQNQGLQSQDDYRSAYET